MRLGLLLTIFFALLPAARADEIIAFTITGGVTASGTMTLGAVADLNLAQQNVVQPIESMTGTLDGQPITLLNPTLVATGAPSDALWTQNIGPNMWDGPIFTAGGQTWGLWDNDEGIPGWFTFLGNLTTQTYANPIDFEFTIVSTPEASILMLLCIGFLGLVTLRSLKS